MKHTCFLNRLHWSRRIAPAGLSALLALTAPSANAQPANAQPANATSAANAQPANAPNVAQPREFLQGILFPYSLLDRALKGKVDKNGNVDYVALKGDKDLDLFLRAVATADLSKFPVLEVKPLPDDKTAEAPVKDGKDGKEAKPVLNRNAELVFWINAYNAHVLKALADAYPINGPDDIKDFDIAKTRLIAGQRWSFRDLRKKIVGFDPRALFALTNGTRGGPLLEARAYRFANLNAALEAATNIFVNDRRNVSVERIQNKVTLSDYFVEANELFTRRGDRKKLSGARSLLAAYSDKRANRSYFTTNDYRIEIKPADRSLNIKSR